MGKCAMSGDFASHAGSFGPPDRIIDLAPVDYAHQQLAFAFGGARDQLFHLGGAGAAVEEGHEGAGVQDGLLVSLASLLRAPAVCFQ